jgi:hypothetical protein
MSTEEPPEVVEIPVKQFDVTIRLEDILARMERAHGVAQALQLAPGPVAPAPGDQGVQPVNVAPADTTTGDAATPDASTDDAQQPGIAQRLRRIGELSRQLREEINQINQIDPTLLGRLKEAQRTEPPII